MPPGAGAYLVLSKVSLLSYPELWTDSQVPFAKCTFPTGSQDDEREMRARKACTNPAGLTPGAEHVPTLEYFGAGLLPARPLRRLVRGVCYVCTGGPAWSHPLHIVDSAPESCVRALLLLTVLPHACTPPRGLEPGPLSSRLRVPWQPASRNQ